MLKKILYYIILYLYKDDSCLKIHARLLFYYFWQCHARLKYTLEQIVNYQLKMASRSTLQQGAKQGTSVKYGTNWVFKLTWQECRQEDSLAWNKHWSMPTWHPTWPTLPNRIPYNNLVCTGFALLWDCRVSRDKFIL